MIDRSAFARHARAAGIPHADIADAFERFEERAAIREFDGGFPRAEAERLALQDALGSPRTPDQARRGPE